VRHDVLIHHEPPRHGYSLLGGHRARCSCGWGSDCYAQLSDTQRAIEVHLRRAQREDFEGLIARSSIGAAVADVKARGIDAHLADLAREMNRHRRRQSKRIAQDFSALNDHAKKLRQDKKRAR
jgi:uncharacterized protein YdbL (DUF1318 family)